ncbi:peptidylprolyl isomerase [Arcobacter vandammei]|uniref:peptidylprolyl isomerase n=1 Tax=Arcobacter vandammei TaxID=2782243 RepID=UPI0018DFA9CF|nr:peptidylprolyl isomerase [Arcobacter vandammei]
MNKLLLSLFLGSSLLCAAPNGIAILVNDEPITIYDIEKTMSVNKISKNEAVSYLIDKALYDQQVEKNNITADIFEINDHIEKLANANGMDIYTFKSIVKQEYPNYEVFENEAKNAVTRQKLIQQIVKGQLTVATDEDMELYYEKNKNKYTSAKNFEVIQYISKNKASLNQVLQNPMLNPSEVTKTSLNLDTSNLPAQFQYILNNTKDGAFTPIFTADKNFVTMFVVKRSGTTTQSFEAAKAKIFNDIMMKREQDFLKEHFEKQKLTADIKVLR